MTRMTILTLSSTACDALVRVGVVGRVLDTLPDSAPTVLRLVLLKGIQRDVSILFNLIA
jgi:hypothetical protein